MINQLKISKITTITSVVLFLISLTQPAYCTSDCKNSLLVLLLGPLGILVELGTLINFILEILNGHHSSLNEHLGSTFTWLANPLIIFSWIICKYSVKTTLILNLLALILILSFLSFDKVLNNEAGHYSQIININAGYWIWLSSSLIMIIGSLLTLKKQGPLKSIL